MLNTGSNLSWLQNGADYPSLLGICLRTYKCHRVQRTYQTYKFGTNVTPVFRVYRIYNAHRVDPTDHNEGQWVCEGIAKQTNWPSLLSVGSPRRHRKYGGHGKWGVCAVIVCCDFGELEQGHNKGHTFLLQYIPIKN